MWPGGTSPLSLVPRRHPARCSNRHPPEAGPRVFLKRLLKLQALMVRTATQYTCSPPPWPARALPEQAPPWPAGRGCSSPHGLDPPRPDCLRALFSRRPLASAAGGSTMRLTSIPSEILPKARALTLRFEHQPQNASLKAPPKGRAEKQCPALEGTVGKPRPSKVSKPTPARPLPLPMKATLP